jgi:hypothetical protein
MLVQDAQPVKDVYIPDAGMPAKGPHVYKGREAGYIHAAYVHQEYPKGLYRARTAEEIQYERDNTPLDVWRDKETDLLQLTGHNQKKDIKSYEAWVTRHLEIVVSDEKEEKKAIAQGYKSLAELSKDK